MYDKNNLKNMIRDTEYNNILAIVHENYLEN